MTKGILGGRVGTTQISTKNGILALVTIIEATPNIILQVKTNGSGGYKAVQVGRQDMREVLSNKPARGHTAEAETSPKRFIREIRDAEPKDYRVGSEIAVGSFSGGDVADVTGATGGHGTRGNVKYWGQLRGPETCDSRHHRVSGSMGSIVNRVPKGKKLPGHMGDKEVTVQNLVIERVVPEKSVLLVKGNVPSAKNSLIFVRSTAKVAE